jgi:Nif-specific regulatory protein
MSTSDGLTWSKAGAEGASALVEISQILTGAWISGKWSGRSPGAGPPHELRGTLALVNRETGEISIDAAHGLSESQKEKGRYRLGEGVTGKVIQSGKPAVVPRVSQEPQFLNRTGARSGLRKKDIAFICVPIKIGNEVLGAISTDRLLPVGFTSRGRAVLQIIGSMIAQGAAPPVGPGEKRKLLAENQRLQEDLKDKFPAGQRHRQLKQMRTCTTRSPRVRRRSQTTVLIRGERHRQGARRPRDPLQQRPGGEALHRVNCAALPRRWSKASCSATKGAFTGALAARQGRFELANGGTIFLTKSAISRRPRVQLRVLQEREFERVGGNAPLKTDVRVIAATNRDLEAMITEGKFRQDLYYRLNVFSIHLPALRERKADILLLADFFVEKYSKANRRSVKRISTPAIDMLMAYHWPGNVRELENCIERAVLVSNDEVIHGYHLPPTLQTAEASGTVTAGPLQAALDNVEREMITEALKSCRGNMAKAAIPRHDGAPHGPRVRSTASTPAASAPTGSPRAKSKTEIENRRLTSHPASPIPRGDNPGLGNLGLPCREGPSSRFWFSIFDFRILLEVGRAIRATKRSSPPPLPRERRGIGCSPLVERFASPALKPGWSSTSPRTSPPALYFHRPGRSPLR